MEGVQGALWGCIKLWYVNFVVRTSRLFPTSTSIPSWREHPFLPSVHTPEPQGLIHALHSAFFIRWALFKTSAGGRGALCGQRSESLNLMFWEHKLSHISVSLHIAFPKTSLPSSTSPNQSSRYVPTHLLSVPSSTTFSMKFSLVPPGRCRGYSPYGHWVHTSLIVIATSSVSLLSAWALCKDRDHVSSSLCPQGITQTLKYLLNKWLNRGIWRNSQCAAIRARD